MPRIVPVFTVAIAVGLGACAIASAAKPPMTTVKQVDLPRFMGPWYVLASIPTFLEKDAYNAVESYALKPDGSIAVEFTFHKGSYDGPLKTMKPHGFVRDTTNALWGMRFVWPIKAEYRIAYLDASYSQVVIARSARDYVWIMARTPEISVADYQKLVDFTRDLGYDISKLRKVPQRWP